jgi:drug/metabolite transporter (DMT)-like permease
MLPFWQTPTFVQLAWFVVIGGLGSLNHLCMAQALKEAEITAILPIAFTRLIWASIIGYVVFAEVPDLWIWVGGVMIFSAATYIAFRERAVKKAPTAPEAGT